MRPFKKISYVAALLTVILFSAYLLMCRSNPLNENRADLRELGRYLFYDTRLSINNTRSCGTCHNQKFAFTDGYKRSLGLYADLHLRNTQPLFNLDQLKFLTAADSTFRNVFEQMDNPMLNEHPLEMGMKGNEEKILNRIRADSTYQNLFAHAKTIITIREIKNAIAVFVSSIQSYRSRYDKFLSGDGAALTKEENEGRKLFFSPLLHCSSCHGGKNFSSPDTSLHTYFFNTGLYNIDGRGSYPAYDEGLKLSTKKPGDMGKFRVPSLRNLLYTAPYYHDGSASALHDIITDYAGGGRADKSNSLKHTLITGFTFSEKQKDELVLFLFSLSDSSLISNPLYANPFD